MYCESISSTIYTERGVTMTCTRDEIIALYDKLESIRAVAKETGLSHSTIRQVLVDSGIYPSDQTKRINRLNRYGVPDEEIAEMMNISVKTVRAHLPVMNQLRMLSESDRSELRGQNCRVELIFYGTILG